MKKNRIRICGRKVTTPPTPAMAPLVIRSFRSPGGSVWPTQVESWSKWSPIQSIGYCARVKMLRKRIVITVPRMSQPQMGCVTTASILSLVVGPVEPVRVTTSEAILPMMS